MKFSIALCQLATLAVEGRADDGGEGLVAGGEHRAKKGADPGNPCHGIGDQAGEIDFQQFDLRALAEGGNRLCFGLKNQLTYVSRVLLLYKISLSRVS